VFESSVSIELRGEIVGVISMFTDEAGAAVKLVKQEQQQV
jgi:hypothetical protein